LLLCDHPGMTAPVGAGVRLGLTVAVCLVFMNGVAMTAAPEASDPRASEFEKRRLEMVRTQIEARGIANPRVLAALRAVPRHLLVPANVREFAYEDRPLPIGERQTISQPYIVAAMTELLDPQPDDVVLEIGTGSGYQAAVLSHLVRRVYTIEIVPELAERARRDLAALGYDNVEVITGDGYQGLPEHAPFDGVIVTAAPERIPQPLIDQLGVTGRLVIPVGRHSQVLKVVEKSAESLSSRDAMGVRFVPMTGIAQEKPTGGDR
jgi:protein-L-isoaspartate(D-aspartate) O-methyltransferase